MIFSVTIDHDVIRAWAARKGARPSRPDSEERPWPLLFDRDVPDVGLVEIPWEEFFSEFERANLAFAWRDAGPDGASDDTFEFIQRGIVPELLLAGRPTIVERVF